MKSELRDTAEWFLCLVLAFATACAFAWLFIEFLIIVTKVFR